MRRAALGLMLFSTLASAQEATRVYELGALRRAALYEPQREREGLQLATAALDDADWEPLDAQADPRVEALTRDLAQLPGVAMSRAWSDRLLVRATLPAQAEIARRLEQLERELLRPVEVEAWQLAADSLTGELGAVLAPDEVDALLLEARPLRHLRTATLAGRRARLATQRVETLVAEVDVEGALPAGFADPQVQVLTTGAELGARVVPGAGGAWLVELWGRSGTPRAVREWELAPFAPMRVALPEVATTRWRATATLADGAGVLVGLDDGDGGAWLVRVRGEPGGSERLASVGAASLPRCWTAPLPFAPVQVSGGWYLDEGLLAERDVEARSRAAPARDEARLAPGYALELRFGALDAVTLRAFDAGELDVAALAARLERRLFGAARGGDAFWSFGGAHRLYVKDHDIEGGMSLRGPDPVTDLVVVGLAFWCQPTPLADGRVLVASELCWQRELGAARVREVPLAPRPTLSPIPTPAGTLELPAAARFVASDLATIEPGAWRLVALTTAPATDGALAAVLRVTR